MSDQPPIDPKVVELWEAMRKEHEGSPQFEKLRAQFDAHYKQKATGR